MTKVTETLFYGKYVCMEDAVKEMQRFGYPHFVVWIPEEEIFSCRHPDDKSLFTHEIIVAMHPKCAERLYFAYGVSPKWLLP